LEQPVRAGGGCRGEGCGPDAGCQPFQSTRSLLHLGAVVVRDCRLKFTDRVIGVVAVGAVVDVGQGIPHRLEDLGHRRSVDALVLRLIDGLPLRDLPRDRCVEVLVEGDRAALLGGRDELVCSGCTPAVVVEPQEDRLATRSRTSGVVAAYQFYGTPFTEDEVSDAISYLLDRGLIQGIKTWGPVLARPALTTAGIECVEHRDGDVRAFLTLLRRRFT